MSIFLNVGFLGEFDLLNFDLFPAIMTKKFLTLQNSTLLLRPFILTQKG